MTDEPVAFQRQCKPKCKWVVCLSFWCLLLWGIMLRMSALVRAKGTLSAEAQKWHEWHGGAGALQPQWAKHTH